MRLAVMTLRGGEEDSVGWPIAKRLIPYYKKTLGPAGSVVALPDHPSVFIGDVAGLETMDDSVDAVLSLCGMGTEEGKLAAREHHEIWLVDSSDPKSNPNLDFVLQDLAEWMVERRDEGRSIFIHCVRAENRTPTVAAAYVAKSTGVSGQAALKSVLPLLPHAGPSPAFAKALDRIWPTGSEGHARL